ncbi:MAG: hypothetical protein KatS3mg043_1494 [Rhodothermaceae bacterium]|nr:MAG: hypothetical protein KatS3mg043_1494 [Rhodothermaceae bacterium]
MMTDDFALIETMRWEGGIRLLPYHAARLAASAKHFGFPFDRQRFQATLDAATAGLDAPHRVRLTLDRRGRFTTGVTALGDAPAVMRLGFATERVDPADPLLYHKTTRRDRYERAYRAGLAAGLDEVLLINTAGAVTEGTRTNLFVEHDGHLCTPPLRAGLLPGVYRAYLLDTRPGIVERELRPEDLRRAERVYVCNAVRGLVEAVVVRSP